MWRGRDHRLPLRTTESLLTLEILSHEEPSLTVVGAGIDVGAQLTPQARAAFAAADEAVYLVSDPVGACLLEAVNPRGRSLSDLYAEGKPRRETYAEMVLAMLRPLREGRQVCAAFYGHPGIFVYPARVALDAALAEGFRARMFPGISSLDCLFADLGLDPAATGCQIHHAHDLLVQRIKPDTATLLLLLQISAIGRPTHRVRADWSGLPTLVDYLAEFYPLEHELIGYEASSFQVARPLVERTPLAQLARARLTPGMTLVVPPATTREVDPTMLARLGLARR